MTNTDRFELTDPSIEADCRPPEGGKVDSRGRLLQERFYWDAELRGLGLVAVFLSARSWPQETQLRAVPREGVG